MPEQDKKLVAHMQTTAEREIKAKKVRLAGRGGGGGGDEALISTDSNAGRGGGGKEGEAGISKALRTFDAIMEGEGGQRHRACGGLPSRVVRLVMCFC